MNSDAGTFRLSALTPGERLRLSGGAAGSPSLRASRGLAAPASPARPASPQRRAGLVPPSLQPYVRPLDLGAFCDLCCGQLGAAYEMSCGHAFCKSCLAAIAEMDMRCPADPYSSQAGALAPADGGERAPARGSPLPALQELECPACLRLCSRVRERQGSQRMVAPSIARPMCAECGERVAEVRCSTCGADLCAECDQKVHGFRATSGHSREALSTVREHTGNLPPSWDAPGALSPAGAVASRSALEGSSSAPTGSASQAPVSLYCHGAAHRNPLSTSTGPASLGVPSLSGLVSPASDPQFGRPLATHYCVETGELLCPDCVASSFYSGKTLLTVDEGASRCAAQVRDASARVRGLASAVREHLVHLRGLGRCSASYLSSALSELQAVRRAVVAAVEQRFGEIEAQLSQMAQKRAEAVAAMEAKDSSEVQAAVDCALACEKHVAQRQAGVLLLEYPAMHGDLQDAVTRLSAYVGEICPRGALQGVSQSALRNSPQGPEQSAARSASSGHSPRAMRATHAAHPALPRVCPYPRLLPVGDLVDLLDERLRFRQDDVLAEEANRGLVFSGQLEGSQARLASAASANPAAAGSPHTARAARLGCKKCGAPLLNLRGRDALETAAEHRRGALCGIRPELAFPGSLVLDSRSGEASARLLRCKKCSCELGRWAEEGSAGRGYQPSLLYVSSNGVTPLPAGP